MDACDEKSEALQCKICILDYDSETNETLTPRILKECGHTVCHGCADGLLREGRIDCPFCRKPTTVNGGVASLPKNYAIIELLGDMELEKPKKSNSREEPESEGSGAAVDVPCIENASHEAVVFCNVCSSDFCNKCFDSLHECRAFADHLKLPLSEKPIQLPKCSKHLYNFAEFICKELECEEDLKIICHTCLLSEHKSHVFVPLIKILERNQTELQEHSAILHSKLEQMKEKLKEIKMSALSFDMESPFYTEQCQVISDFFDAQKIAAIGEFENFLTSTRQELEQKQEQMEADLATLLEVKGEVDAVLRAKKNLQNAKDLIGRAVAVASMVPEEEDHFPPLNSCQIHFPDNVTVFISPS